MVRSLGILKAGTLKIHSSQIGLAGATLVHVLEDLVAGVPQLCAGCSAQVAGGGGSPGEEDDRCRAKRSSLQVRMPGTRIPCTPRLPQMNGNAQLTSSRHGGAELGLQEALQNRAQQVPAIDCRRTII